jgi:AcrR family transcriptional regulator
MTALSADRIVEAGLSIIDSNGPHALTMRALADELGVSATAIYYYFDGREALLEGIVEHVATGIVAGCPDEGEWQGRLMALLTTMVVETGSHPSIVAWVLTEYAKRPPVLRIHEKILSILHTAGFEPEQAVRIKGTLLRYCAGHLILGIAAPELDWKQVPKDAYTNYRTSREQVKQIENEELFTTGIEILLEGLNKRFARNT